MKCGEEPCFLNTNTPESVGCLRESHGRGEGMSWQLGSTSDIRLGMVLYWFMK